MKKLFATIAASAALLVGAPVASAASSPNSLPISPMTNVSCVYVAGGYGTYTWSFQIPAFSVPYFQSVLSQVQLYFPTLSCTLS